MTTNPQPIATESTFAITVHCSNCRSVYEMRLPFGTKLEQSTWAYDCDLLDVTGRKSVACGEPYTPPVRIMCSLCGAGPLTRRERTTERSAR